MILVSTGNPLPAPVPLDADLPRSGGYARPARAARGHARLGGVADRHGADARQHQRGERHRDHERRLLRRRHGRRAAVPRAGRSRRRTRRPPASIPPIPRFDANPERSASTATASSARTPIDVGGGRRRHRPGRAARLRLPHLHDPARRRRRRPASPAAPTRDRRRRARPRDEFTVASFNLRALLRHRQRSGASASRCSRRRRSTTGWTRRRSAIRNFLGTPDILGVVEVENLTTLQALAAQINTDAVAAAQPDPAVRGVPRRGQRRRRHRRRLPGQDGRGHGRDAAGRRERRRPGAGRDAVRQPRRLHRAAQRPSAAAPGRRRSSSRAARASR